MRRLSLALALVLSVAATPAVAQSGAPDADWARTLAALAGTDAAAAAAVTATAYDRECSGLGSASPADDASRLRQLAAAWAGRPVTWTVRGTSARGLLGPPMPAMSTVCMEHERGAWRFSGYIPGE